MFFLGICVKPSQSLELLLLTVEQTTFKVGFEALLSFYIISMKILLIAF